MHICFVNIHVTLLNKDFPWPLRGFSFFKKNVVTVVIVIVLRIQLAVTASK